jgi:penicillin-binding protein 1C
MWCRELAAAMSSSLRRCIAVAAFALAVPAHALPTFAEVKAAHRPSDVTITDRHGVPIQTLRVDLQVRRLGWVPIEDLSPALLNALVLSEDRHFHEHGGVDWGAIARSAWGTVWNERMRGGSTLTMQLAGLLEDDLARPAGGRSVAQKLGQVVAAQRIEARWSKQQILEAYLNRVGWRGEIVGIGALSQTLFGKLPSGLDAQEAAIAVALLRAPNAPPDTVAARACGVLREQRLDCAGVAALAQGALVRRGGMPMGEQLAPHFARQLLGQARRDRAATSAAGGVQRMPASLAEPGLPLRSTLDARLQRVAIDALRQQMAELSGRHVEDGAVLVLDNATGEVLAWVGSSGRYSDAPAVDGVVARRQPGSTLKPFIYGLAFERRLITPATLLDDAPAQIATASGLYLPQNYDRSFKGWVSARAALGSSLNVPAVRVAAMIGPQAVLERLNAFGLDLPESGSFYGHALALGGADVSLLALTNAYRAMANRGRWSAVELGGLQARRGALDRTPAEAGAAGLPPASPAGHRTGSRQVADAAATWLVGDILSDNNARAMTFGLDSALATRGFAAVKTGTSKDLRDNWCLGYTDRYTVGVWIGNASGEPMHRVSGVSGAAPVWRAVASWLHRDAPSRAPAVAHAVVRSRVAASGLEAARDEFFLAGTQPLPGLGAAIRPAPAAEAAAPGTSTLSSALAAGPRAAAAGRYGIVHPRDGSVFALDPDIPPSRQRLRFEGEAGLWMLNGRRLGNGPTQEWSPWPGRHELTLLGRDGRARQTVHFEVRGAAIKPVVAQR